MTTVYFATKGYPTYAAVTRKAFTTLTPRHLSLIKAIPPQISSRIRMLEQKTQVRVPEVPLEEALGKLSPETKVHIAATGPDFTMLSAPPTVLGDLLPIMEECLANEGKSSGVIEATAKGAFLSMALWVDKSEPYAHKNGVRAAIETIGQDQATILALRLHSMRMHPANFVDVHVPLPGLVVEDRTELA